MSFWIGMGFQYNLIFPDLLTGTWATLLGNGVTTGSIVVILLTLLIELPASGRKRLRVSLDSSALPEIDGFLRSFSADLGWSESSIDRLRSAGEETLASLQQSVSDEDSQGRRLTVTAHVSDGAAELEFLAASHGDNLEDRMAYLGEQGGDSERAGRVVPPAALLRIPPCNTASTTISTSSRFVSRKPLNDLVVMRLLCYYCLW